MRESDRVLILRHNTNEKEIKEAKVKDLQNDVYEEVDYKSQKLISFRWVLSENMNNGETTKARFVARGFEEQKNDTSINVL